jgi:hypothetical protein
MVANALFGLGAPPLRRIAVCLGDNFAGAPLSSKWRF